MRSARSRLKFKFSLSSNTASGSGLRSGHTLVEMLVAAALLGTILALCAGLLETGRRSWTAARRNDALAASRDRALWTLNTALETVVFTRYSRFSPDGSRLEAVSDQHFVHGPARNLLPEVRGLCGDALFFQRRGTDGVTQPTGFLVHYGDDSPWRPRTLPNLKPKWRFRLLQYTPPASDWESVLPRPPSPAPGDILRADGGTSRAETYQWFARPLSDAFSRNCRIAADHIAALLVETASPDPACWDTRRRRWDPNSASATTETTADRPPEELTLHLLIIDDTAWSRLDGNQAAELARELQSLRRPASMDPSQSTRQVLQRMRGKLESQSIPCAVMTTMISVNAGHR